MTPENSTVDGSLDITFGGDGIVTTDFSTSDDRGFATALQKDGKIVVTGFSSAAGSSDFALARYNPDGSLDTTFNGTGLVTTDFGGGDEVANGVVIQEDGKIVAAGYTNAGGNYNFAVARYNVDGSLDTTFNGTGQVTTNFGGFDQAYTLALQQDGKIVVAGFSNSVVAVARYNVDGSLDTSFNGTGMVTTTGIINDSQARAIAIQEDGKIVLAGFAVVAGNANMLVVRYQLNGTLDASFNGTGSVISTFGGTQDVANGVALQKDGKIVLSGTTNVNGDADFAVVRYNSDGSLDTSFNNGTGIVITDFGGDGDRATAVVIQKDGKIIAVGQALNSQLGIARYTTDGYLDTSFNGTGTVVNTSISTGRAALLQYDGKLVVAGFASGAGGFDFAVLRCNIFMRCSSIRESIAQANGRDGFNLEYAFNVALLNSEASCNARNGFLGSSSTANNLYSNLAYNNTANYLSATDLTVQPNSISSYWGNVEPDKTTPDIFADRLSVMESLLYEIKACACTPVVP